MFDGVVATVSLVELFLFEGTGVSVLRAFRLFRIFKLARSLPLLQRWLLVMATSAMRTKVRSASRSLPSTAPVTMGRSA